jgi:hypothetical protein
MIDANGCEIKIWSRVMSLDDEIVVARGSIGYVHQIRSSVSVLDGEPGVRIADSLPDEEYEWSAWAAPESIAVVPQ